MGSITRGKFPHIIDALYSGCSHFEAFQALYLLEQSFECLDAEQELSSMLDLAPAAELTFPAGQLRHLSVQNNGRLRLEFNDLGLYGVSSPLPQFFNDIASRDSFGSQELRAFLDMFNRRLYLLAYLSWKKLNRAESSKECKSLLYRYLNAISGFAEHKGRNDYSGILGGRIKGAQALTDLLQDFLGHPVRVQQNVPQWIRVDERNGLGNGLCLGDNSLIGSQILDVVSQIRIEIGPINMSAAEPFFPQREKAAEINELIGKYIDPAIDIKLILLIQPEAGQHRQLGAKNSLLGWTTCVGNCSGKIHRLNLNIRQQTDNQAKTPQTDNLIEKNMASAA